jgi:hypothetical protein
MRCRRWCAVCTMEEREMWKIGLGLLIIAIVAMNAKDVTRYMRMSAM